MRKALAQSQSPLAEGPLGSGAPGCLAGGGSALSTRPRGLTKGPDQGNNGMRRYHGVPKIEGGKKGKRHS